MSPIQTAVNKIVDAFQAFVTWAIEFINSVITTWSASSGHELFLFIGAGMSLYGLVMSIADLTAIGGTGIYTKMVVVLSTLITGIAFIKSGAMLWEKYHT